jgi:hypothetical protein
MGNVGRVTENQAQRRADVQKPTRGFYERACGRLRSALGELPDRGLLERMREDAEAAFGGGAGEQRDVDDRRGGALVRMQDVPDAQFQRPDPRPEITPPRTEGFYARASARLRRALGELPDQSEIERLHEDAEIAFGGRPGPGRHHYGDERYDRARREHAPRMLESERQRGGERIYTPEPARYGGGGMGYGGFGRRFGEADEGEGRGASDENRHHRTLPPRTTAARQT